MLSFREVGVTEYLYRAYSRARLDDRAVNELIGLAHGLMADGKIDQGEAEYLRHWLATNVLVTDNPLIGCLLDRVSSYLEDGVLDEDEAADLFDALHQFTGGQSGIDGLQMATKLPIDKPVPEIVIPGRRFCFTGTFAFGSRKDCEKAVKELGGSAGSLNRSTEYLVIGVYATGSWAHSSFGRKIEKAIDLKQAGCPVAILGEEHWASSLGL